MDLSTSMTYVMMRAQAETAAAKAKGPAPEFLLLGILKLSELSAEEFAPSSRSKAAIDQDIAQVRARLTRAGVDSARGRSLLRAAVAREGAIENEAGVAACIAQATVNAGRRGEDTDYGIGGRGYGGER